VSNIEETINSKSYIKRYFIISRGGKAMRKTNSIRVISILSVLILLAVAGMANAQQVNEYCNRPGGDYRVFDLKRDYWSDCMNACEHYEKCKAWSYRKPGCCEKGSCPGRCYLKSRVTPAIYDKCYVCGVKEGATSKMPATCPTLSFATTSPLPSAVIGGDYSYKIKASGGVPPFTFYPVIVPADGTHPIYDTSTDQRKSMPSGLHLSKDGLISGQLQSNAPVGYIFIMIRLSDSCPSGAQVISKKFYINIKQQH
jgi:hypothetical protein